jgi:LDH2 family malate/lactate/ureidoglycolate dehydrogenase
MATSAVAFGKVEIAVREDKPIPLGWALDREGYPTTDPKAMIDGGALVSLGGDREHGGHKGYGLALAVDVLCAVLSGANWGPFAPPFALRQALPEREVGKGIGHFFGAMRVDAFRDVSEFKSHIDDFIRTLRATRPAPGTSGPLLPGDPERAAQKERDAGGVPLLPAVLDDLRDIARLTGVPLE